MTDDRDDDTAPVRGPTLREHARRDAAVERTRPGAYVEGAAVREQRGRENRDTARLDEPRASPLRDTDERIRTLRRGSDFADEPTPVRAVRELDVRVEEIERHIVDLHGESGQNGKLGKLSDKVRLLLWLAGLIVASAVAGVGAAVHLASERGEQAGALRQQVENNTDSIESLRALVWELARNPSPKGVTPP